MTRARAPRKRLRRAGLVVLLLIVVVAGLALAAGAGGTYESYPRSALQTAAQRARAPAWTRPCWATARTRAEFECVHVTGRLLWTQHHDPDGDGDRHFIVIEHLRPRIVKITKDLPVPHLPSLGSHIDATGYLMLGGSGHHEVDSRRFEPGGPDGSAG